MSLLLASLAGTCPSNESVGNTAAVPVCVPELAMIASSVSLLGSSLSDAQCAPGSLNTSTFQPVGCAFNAERLPLVLLDLSVGARASKLACRFTRENDDAVTCAGDVLATIASFTAVVSRLINSLVSCMSLVPVAVSCAGQLLDTSAALVAMGSAAAAIASNNCSNKTGAAALASAAAVS